MEGLLYFWEDVITRTLYKVGYSLLRCQIHTIYVYYH